MHLAVARPLASRRVLVCDQRRTHDGGDLGRSLGLRFDIEENFLDDKSNGFQLEASLLRSSEALERLCFVLAMTTLYLVSLGTAVVQQGKRRVVDPHWFRGIHYLKIGWKWVSYALSRGYASKIQRVFEQCMGSRTRDGLKETRSTATTSFCL